MDIKIVAHTKQVNHLETGLPFKEEALSLGGRMAGICYGPEDYFDTKINNLNTAYKRAENCIKSGHHSPFDHVFITLQITNIPKIAAMILNSTEYYTTSEKSARYTLMQPENQKELELYEKWLIIFKDEIKKYSDKEGLNFSEKHIEKLSMENARYMISVFTPTSMCYTTSIRKYNYLIAWLERLQVDLKKNPTDFNNKLAPCIKELKDKLYDIFGYEIKDNKNGYFNFLQYQHNPEAKVPYYTHHIGSVYSVVYEASFAHLAHIQRHRTLHYEMFFDGREKVSSDRMFACYIPPILSTELRNEWIKDFNSIKEYYPQATLVTVLEEGRCEDFLLKCKERICSRAQLEVMNGTIEILNKFNRDRNRLSEELKEKVINYYKKPRCMYEDFKCTEKCEFGPKNALERII